MVNSDDKIMMKEKLMKASKWFDDLSAFADMSIDLSDGMSRGLGEVSQCSEARTSSEKSLEDKALTRRMKFCQGNERLSHIDWDACDPLRLADADRRAKADYAYVRPEMNAKDVQAMKSKWRRRQLHKYSLAASVLGPRETQKNVYESFDTMDRSSHGTVSNNSIKP
jgi:hypothetical protein